SDHHRLRHLDLPRPCLVLLHGTEELRPRSRPCRRRGAGADPMSIVVGVVPGRDPRPPVRLGAVMARSYGRRLLLVSIISSTWGSGGGRADAEFRRWRDRETARCLEAAAAMVPDGIAVEQLSREARSPRSGLLRVCREVGAYRLV